MKYKALLSKWDGLGWYRPVSVHPSTKAALAQIKFLGGILASRTDFHKFPGVNTYTIDLVESYGDE